MKKLMLICAVAGMMLSASSLALATTVTLVPGELNVAPGSTVDISVNMSVDSDITMTAISTILYFDQNVFEAVNNELGGAIVQQGSLLTVDWDLMGNENFLPIHDFRVSSFLWSEPYENLAAGASGTLYTFTLKVKETAPLGLSPLTWDDAAGFVYGDAEFYDVVVPATGVSINVIPEPTTLLLLGLGGLLLRKRKI